MLKTMLIAFAAALIGVGSANAVCSLNPDAKNKCEPALMKFYKPVLKRWRRESRGENSILNSKYWLEKPDCLPKRTSSLDCAYIGDVAMHVTELPQAQLNYRTYAVTILACSGVSGASCHLYHRVYMIVDGTMDGKREITLCSDLSCP